MLQQFELNKELLSASESSRMYEIKRLLQKGAQPLGSSNPNDPDEHILGELFCSASLDDKLAENLESIVKVFLEYGMDIAAEKIPDDDGNNINPLWDLSFVRNEYAIKTLKLLLDNNLDVESAEILVEHIFMDTEMCDGCEIEDERFYNSLCVSLKMVMLVSSYPNIIDNSGYIRVCIDVDHNDDEKLILFRNWNDFDYCVDKSTCTNLPDGLLNATLNIKDKASGEIVWTFLI